MPNLTYDLCANPWIGWTNLATKLNLCIDQQNDTESFRVYKDEPKTTYNIYTTHSCRVVAIIILYSFLRRTAMRRSSPAFFQRGLRRSLSSPGYPSIPYGPSGWTAGCIERAFNARIRPAAIQKITKFKRRVDFLMNYNNFNFWSA